MLKANEGAKFSQEYESIEPGQQFTWDASNLDINKPKNRYANVIAYDHSRVVLQSLDGVTGGDYINANYMDGYRRQNAYIATQVSNTITGGREGGGREGGGTTSMLTTWMDNAECLSSNTNKVVFHLCCRLDYCLIFKFLQLILLSQFKLKPNRRTNG